MRAIIVGGWVDEMNECECECDCECEYEYGCDAGRGG